MNALTERHVQALWYDAALRPSRLYTRRGLEVRVITPGEWNLAAGPDFRNAVLEIGRERRRLTGDIEVHLAPSDWTLHGHGADPRYHNVIAHVTWGCGPAPETLPGGAVSIWLGRFFTGNPAFSAASIDLAAYPYARLPDGVRPCELKLAHDPEVARRVLTVAGRHRLRMKARRLLGRMGEAVARVAGVRSIGEVDVRRQLYYEEVMSALGYVRNVLPFRRVAERVPIAELPAEVAAAKAALLTAGTFEEWDRAGTRPGNDPELRLARAAELFATTAVIDTAAADDFSVAACRRLVAEICSGHLVGRGRAGAIVSNVVVPWAIAEGRLAEAPEWLPPEDVSDPVRLTAFRMFGRDHNPAAFYSTNGLLIQGLLQIHRDYCLQVHPDCSECRLVRQGAAG